MLIGGIVVLAAILAVALCVGCGTFGSLMWLWLLPIGFLGSVLILGALAFAFLWIMCAIVKMDVPQEKDSKFYRRMTYLYVDAILVLLQMRVHTVGLENTPKEGRFLLVCNHLNILDPVTLLAFFKQSKLAFISKRENDRMLIVGKLMHKIMCQSINRENDREALKTILKCIQLIKDDEVSIAVFPEGYTSLDGRLHPFRSGVFKIAQKANVPIVVCTLQNTQHIFRNAVRLRPTKVELHLVGVIPAEELKGVTTVQIGERVHAMMAADLGPENVLETAHEEAQNT